MIRYFVPVAASDTNNNNNTNTNNHIMKTYLAELNDGGKNGTFDTMEEALEYIAKNFRTEASELGTWQNSPGEETLVWVTQEDADAAEDNSDVIATIIESDA